MNRIPTTILSVGDRPVMIRRSYGGTACAYDCFVTKLGMATSYKPGRRIAKFADLDQLLASINEAGMWQPPAQNNPVTLRRVAVSMPKLPTDAWNQSVLQAAIKRQAQGLGYLVETLELSQGEFSVNAYKGASLDVFATVEICRVIGKALRSVGVQGGVQ